MNESKRAVIYARVAAQGLNDDKLSTQAEACQQYADQHGLAVTVDRIITEVCSGSTRRRPGLDRVRALSARREIDAVIVIIPDRLSRDLDESLFLCEEWQRSGIELHCLSHEHICQEWLREVPTLSLSSSPTKNRHATKYWGVHWRSHTGI